jgi:exosortase/archaeosortase family protein
MVLAGLVLAPHLFGILASERWPTLALVGMTIGFIGTKHAHAESAAPQLLVVGFAASTGLLVAGYMAGVDKLMFAAGIGFFWVGLCCEKKTLAFPFRLLATLALVMPLPANLETQLAIWLSDTESTLFVTIGQAAGFDVYKLGTQVIANDVAVSINSDCSGSLLLVPSILGMLSASAASGTRGLKFGRLMAIILPLAFGINFVRLTVLVFANFTASAETAAFLHDTLGWLFMPLAWLLPLVLFGKTPVNTTSHEKALPLVPISMCALTLAIAIPLNGSGTQNTLDVPYYFGEWVGEDQSVSDAEYSLLGTDQIIRRLYTSVLDDDEILVTFILHDSVSKGLEHTSANCFRAMGWAVDKMTTKEMPNNRSITKMRVTDYERSQLVTELTGTLPTGTRSEPAHLRVQIVTRQDLRPSATSALVSLLENNIQLNGRTSS